MHEPIAIVGRSCLFPGARNAEQFQDRLRRGDDLISSAPAGRWRLSRAHALGDDGGEESWSDRGGYVTGFDDVFDPSGFGLDPERILSLDPLFQWTLHTGREALRDAGIDGGSGRVSVLLGNLSFPCEAMTEFGESVWLDAQGGDFADRRRREEIAVRRRSPENRFMSGYPAHLLSEALGLGRAYALDAACASSLYAIRLACDQLRRGEVDVALTGAVNRADSLFLHVGFCALNAMSRTGQSRPFHRDADGLVPAEGAAFVALKRLDDAIAAGDRIYGVVRSVGLSNDGRSGGFLAPAREGQARAIQNAYRHIDLEPADVSYVECHATGTPLGDGTELESMREFWEDHRVMVGSHKSNIGHAITAAGLAGVLKVLAAFEDDVIAPTLHADAPIGTLTDGPFDLIGAAREWKTEGVRRAAVNAFGFGGNNAHVVVEEYVGGGYATEGPHPRPLSWEERGERATEGPHPRPLSWEERGERATEGPHPRPLSVEKRKERGEIAVVAVEVVAGSCDGAEAFVDAWVQGRRVDPGIDEIALDLDGLRFPPRDLEETLGQQLLMLDVAGRAVDRLDGELPRETTGVFVGMQCDPETVRYGARWRARDWADAWGKDAGWMEAAQEAFTPRLRSEGVVGSMPNIPANRINSQLDLAGPSFSISTEEASGLDALEIARRLLEDGELDAAIVGAVELGREPVHEAAARALLGDDFHDAADASVALVLKRLGDAERDGDTIYAVLDEPDDEAFTLSPSPGEGDATLTSQFGHAHAATGLLHVAAAALACHHGVRPGFGEDRGPNPWLVDEHQSRRARVDVSALGAQHRSVSLRSRGHRAAPLPVRERPEIHVISGVDRDDVRRKLEAGEVAASDDDPARLALVSTPGELETRAALAASMLLENRTWDDGIYFREEPIDGDFAFVFTGSASPYVGMGRELLCATPELWERLSERLGDVATASQSPWVYGWGMSPTLAREAADVPENQIWSASFVSQFHADLTQRIFGLQPDAVIGFSLGESNALFGMGAWNDLDAMLEDLPKSKLFRRDLAGDFAAVREAWGQQGHVEAATADGIPWQNWTVIGPVEKVHEAVEGEELIHLSIVNAPNECVIGGFPDVCDRVLTKLLNSPKIHATRLNYAVAIHVPEVTYVADAYRDLHHRTTTPVDGVRFYTNATGETYELSDDGCADAILGQAVETLDFPRTIEQAWEDGVRVFLEHGPRPLCTNWIDRILGDREHVAVALDQPGKSSLQQVLNAAAQLVIAGVDVDWQALTDGLVEFRPRELEHPLALPARKPLVELPPLEEAQWMEPAPQLPPVLDQTPNTEHRTPSAERRTPNAEHQTPNAEHRRPNAESRTPNAERQKPNAESRKPNAEHRATTPTGRVGEVHREFIDRQTALHHQFLEAQRRGVERLRCAFAATDHTAVADGLNAPASLETRVPPTRPEPTAQDRAEPTAPGRHGPPPEARRHAMTREDLEFLSRGNVSEIFGPEFRPQDDYDVVVRMPEPPLLLADRVIGIDAPKAELGTGTIWTETDVREDSWYLHDGRMPAGVMIESGQADLLLVSWLGIDLLNKGERAYRLLGCDLTYHGDLPKPGDTLKYDIHVDGFARHGDVRLFFFHYDCRVDGEVRLSVRHGQAGFFTHDELLESGGVIWDAETAEFREDVRLDPPAIECTKSAFSHADLVAFSEGRTHDCFGPGFEWAQTHLRSPRIESGDMLLLGKVTGFDTEGGVQSNGYLRVETAVSPDDWFFEGHFHNDPCMPGTLMFEACLQAMAFYMAGCGYTLPRDGWRFRPVAGEEYDMRCRGQVDPESDLCVYEVFVEEMHDGPNPTLYADLLVTVDGLKAFHCRRMGLELVADYPLDADALPSGGDVVAGPRELLSIARGKPSDAFGEMYEVFDEGRRVPRLPGPPYHFVSRVVESTGRLSMEPGAHAVVEYDVPDEAWYFDAGDGEMPYACLLEAGLQPCGWLASWVGCTVDTDRELFFRNLDGTGTLHAEVTPSHETLTTRTELTKLSRSGGMIIVEFDVVVHADGDLVYEMTTVFGFFPAEALAAQQGLEPQLAVPDDDHVPVDASFDDTTSPAVPSDCGIEPADFGERPLKMLDRVTGFWPEGGEAGLGLIRAEKDVDPAAWYFKAHFFQDPVQAGSLGLEAMLQLLKLYMIEVDMADESSTFETIALDDEHTWTYRGQVLPTNDAVEVVLEVLERTENRTTACAELRVDGLTIYRFSPFAVAVARSV